MAASCCSSIDFLTTISYHKYRRKQAASCDDGLKAIFLPVIRAAKLPSDMQTKILLADSCRRGVMRSQPTQARPSIYARHFYMQMWIR